LPEQSELGAWRTLVDEARMATLRP
jgi:hypothetical protein